MSQYFNSWFDTFLEEKNLRYTSWDIVDSNGNNHFIDSDAVIETIKNASTEDQKKIKNIIVQIDFHNGDVNHFFRWNNINWSLKYYDHH